MRSRVLRARKNLNGLIGLVFTDEEQGPETKSKSQSYIIEELRFKSRSSESQFSIIPFKAL